MKIKLPPLDVNYLKINENTVSRRIFPSKEIETVPMPYNKDGIKGFLIKENENEPENNSILVVGPTKKHLPNFSNIIRLEIEPAMEILANLNDGDGSSAGELFRLIYADLRALADNSFQQFRPGQTLQPTALVHEAYLRLVAASGQKYESRAHFLAVAAKAMRHVLIDYARGRGAQKRGGQGWRQITLDGALAITGPQIVDLLSLDETLGRLASLHERQAQVAEMRVFGGLTLEESAEVLGVGVTTVKSDWLIAKTWLKRELAGKS